MGKSGNYPQAALETVPPEAVRQIVTSLKQLHDMGHPGTDEEVKDRIDQYFEFCEYSSIRPGVESLCLSLHITRQTLLNWSNGLGCSEKRQEIAQSARAFLAAYLEQVTLQGKLNPASSCFMFKNWFNYHDNVTVEQTKEPERRALSAAELPKLSVDDWETKETAAMPRLGFDDRQQDT